MVPAGCAERRAERRRVYGANLHARLAHAVPERARHAQAPEPVVEYPHAHTLRRLFDQRGGEAFAGIVRLEYVVVQVDPVLCGIYGTEPIIVGVRPIF